MDNLNKLAAMGCGSEILNSVIDRSNINAAIYNATTFLKYYKGTVKSGLHTLEQATNGIYPYYKKLKEVRVLAELYKELWFEKWCKITLQIEKFTNNQIN